MVKRVTSGNNGVRRGRGKPRPPVSKSEHLRAVERFTWGFLGGCSVLLIRFAIYVAGLPLNAECPRLTYRLCLCCVLWFLYPLTSGLVCLARNPQDRFRAMLQGAAWPALFCVIAEQRLFEPNETQRTSIKPP